jgi:3-ketoacyl-CoA synthase
MATEPSPQFLNSVRLKYVKLGYQYLVNHILTFLLIPVIVAISIELARVGPEEILSLICSIYDLDLIYVMSTMFLFIIAGTVYYMSRPRSIYLVDYACFRPKPYLRVPFSTFLEHARLVPQFDEKTVRFQVVSIDSILINRSFRFAWSTK